MNTDQIQQFLDSTEFKEITTNAIMKEMKLRQKARSSFLTYNGLIQEEGVDTPIVRMLYHEAVKIGIKAIIKEMDQIDERN